MLESYLLSSWCGVVATARGLVALESFALRPIPECNFRSRSYRFAQANWPTFSTNLMTEIGLDT